MLETARKLRLAPCLTIMAICVVGVQGCVFSVLDDDLARLDRATHLFAGEVIAPKGRDEGIVIVAMRDDNGEKIAGFRMLSDSGPFEIRAVKKKTWIFAFYDGNHDLIFQADEPHAWANDGRALDPDIEATDDLEIVLTGDSTEAVDAPGRLVDEPLENKFGNYVKLNIGTVSALDDTMFSMEQAEKGLWQPFEFTEDGGAGVHFMEEYDPDRIPVLFVHGISGTPQNFRHLIETLDTSRYQAWVVSYPSGMRLDWIARGVYQTVEVLQVQHGFKDMHVVAHSMGGLVSRGALNICAEDRRCDYVRSYTTISTPWNGVASAENGTKWSPTVIPVWWDLVPSSEYITTLFDTPLPTGITYHLMFGYRQDRQVGAESSDGVIKLTSQLRSDAQTAADSIFGYDEGHVSILNSDATAKRIADILDSSQTR